MEWEFMFQNDWELMLAAFSVLIGFASFFAWSGARRVPAFPLGCSRSIKLVTRNVNKEWIRIPACLPRKIYIWFKRIKASKKDGHQPYPIWLHSYFGQRRWFIW